MPIHPNVRRCTHIKVTGHRCGSPALKQEYFCYFHTRMIKGVQTRVDSQIHPVALIENAEAIQAALMHMIDAVLKGTIDLKRANILLKALHIAVRNSRNVFFHIPGHYGPRSPQLRRPIPDRTSRTKPSESNNIAPDALVPENATAETVDLKPAKDCHPEEAQAFAKRRPANEGSMHLSSPHPSEGNGEKPGDDIIPPLTTEQSKRREEIEKLEASIEGAMRGNWRDLRTVFNAVGLTPRKPPTSSSHRKARGTKQKSAAPASALVLHPSADCQPAVRIENSSRILCRNRFSQRRIGLPY